MRILALAALVATVVGCGSSRHERLADSSDGRAVLQDAYDGHLDRHWSCGSLRAALRRLPGDRIYSTLPVIIGRTAAGACDAALAELEVGATRAQVRSSLGAPDSGSRCWVTRWPPADAGQSVRFKGNHPAGRRSSVDGARVCFSGDRAVQIQTAVHS